MCLGGGRAGGVGEILEEGIAMGAVWAASWEDDEGGVL